MRERWLGGLSAREFLRRHWQKRPLLARAGWTAPAGLADTPSLFGLAARADVESRLVMRRGERFTVEHGPFTRARLGRLPARNWTLLVNGLNLHHAAAEQLLRRFDFVPQARLDDVMVSLAAPGGGVGPHYDSYDVFLLQGPGRRVWRLQRARRFRLIPEAPLKLIADFRPDEEILLEPNDLLYLPPGWGHDGVALAPSWTYSIGFRAPRGAELSLALLDYLQERGLPDAAYRDPERVPAVRSAAIGADMAEFALRVTRRIRWTGSDVQRVLGRYLTLPKPQVLFEPPHRPLPRADFLRRLPRSTVALDARSMLLYRGPRFYLNGEDFVPPAAQRRTLAALADRRRSAGAALARVGLGDLLYAWYRSGLVRLQAGA